MQTNEERVNYIMNEIQKKKVVKVAELSEALECSEVTIRNDIRNLDEKGYLKRVHGGAVRRDDGLIVNFHQGEYLLNKEEKERIAEKAYQYIHNRDSIILDDSTTGYYLAKLIKRNSEKRIIVVTNSILNAAELSSVSHVELFMVGGHVLGNPPSALDSLTIEAFKQFHVAKAFIGCNGISIKNGVSSLGAPQRDVKKMIVDISDELYVLADHSKFEGSNLFSVCPIERVKCVITDGELSESIREDAKMHGVHLDMV